MRKAMTELLTLLRAKDNLIYIQSYEEDEVMKELCRAATRSQSGQESFVPPRIYVYTRPLGLYEVNVSKPNVYNHEKRVKEVRNTMDALEFVMNLQNQCEVRNTGSIMDKVNKNRNLGGQKEETKDMSPAIFVFKDFHLFLGDKDILRMIRDIKENYSSPNYCPIIVTAPSLELPPELEKIFTYYEFPLMDKSEIAERFSPTLKKLNMDENVVDSIIESSVGLTNREIERAIYHSIAKNITISNKKIVTPQDIHEEKIQIIKKSGALDFIRPEHTLEDLGGCDNFKLWIKKVKEAMSPEAEEFGIPKPKGAMLVGVPGTSKTVSAEILASYLNIPLLSLDMAKVMGSFVGQSERQISNALRITKSVAPCVLVLDEMEKILGGVQSSNSTDSGTLSRVMSQLLNFLQQENTNVITIMTSNDVSQLPPELTRSGRIDAQWMFDLPNDIERGEIINIYLEKNKLQVDSTAFTYFVAASENFTGAEIKSAVKDAMINSFYRQKESDAKTFTRNLTIEDIKSAIDNTVTVWKSNREKIEAFRTYSRSRYLNASKTPEEIKAESKNKKIPNNISAPVGNSNVININFGSDK